SEPSSPTPAHDSTPASLMLAPFVRNAAAHSGLLLVLWRPDQLCCCRTFFADARPSPSTRERIPAESTTTYMPTTTTRLYDMAASKEGTFLTHDLAYKKIGQPPSHEVSEKVDRKEARRHRGRKPDEHPIKETCTCPFCCSSTSRAVSPKPRTPSPLPSAWR